MIEDNGVGIPESVMKQINAMLRGEDIFYQVNRSNIEGRSRM